MPSSPTSDGFIVKVHHATVVITVANSGLGLACALEAPSRGARKAYAAAREPAKVTLHGEVPVGST
jgi:NAD(P)-dependent dehydrogenase (short-subunit alcohol dehydrogenase family)